MKNLILKTCFLLLTLNSFSQFKASIYTESYFGLEVNLSEKISTELRFNGNKNQDGIQNETLFLYQLYKKNYYRVKLGFGIEYRLFKPDGLDSFIFPLQFEIKPFEKYEFITLVFEPSIISELESSAYFRSLIGLKIKL